MTDQDTSADLDEGPLIQQWFYHWRDPRVQKNSLITAVFVGSILVLINSFDYIIQGKLSVILGLKSMLTFIVPYLVASFSSVRSQLRLKPDYLAPTTGTYRCEACLREGEFHDVDLEEGDPIPPCQVTETETLFTHVK